MRALRLPAAMVVAVGLALLFAFNPLTTVLTQVIAWAHANATLATPLFVIASMLAGVLMLPASVLTLAGGFLFGLPLGLALVVAGALGSSTVAFVLGRRLLRQRLLRRFANQPQFLALDHATHHEGFMIVLLARLSPLIPFHLLSYVMSVTAVRLRDFAAATLLGMLPVTTLYVYVGSLARNLSQLTSGGLAPGPVGWLLFGLGLCATLALALLVARRSTVALREHLRRESAALEAETDRCSLAPQDRKRLAMQFRVRRGDDQTAGER